MIDQRKSVIVTGAAGFIGSHAARHFRDQGWSVIGIDSVAHENAPLENMATYHCLQLPDKALNSILIEHSPEAFIHCAGTSSVERSISDPAADFHNNTVLTFEVLNALRLNVPLCRFIFLSSAAVYGNPSILPVTEETVIAPISPYGFHKWQCEQICREFHRVYGVSTAIVRIFSAYGPGLKRQVIWDICHKIDAKKDFVLQGTGRESRDFIHISDIVRAVDFVASLERMAADVYNLACGREITIAELAGMVLRAFGSDQQIKFDNISSPGMPTNWRADITKLRNLGFNPNIRIEDGIREFVKWFQENKG